MASGYLDASGKCNTDALVSAYSILSGMFPRPLNTTGITSSNSAFEVLNSFIISTDTILYKTVSTNGVAGAYINASGSIKLVACNTDNFTNNNNGLAGIYDISPAQGALIGGAILAVWAVAWGVRQFVQTLNINDERSYHE